MQNFRDSFSKWNFLPLKYFTWHNFTQERFTTYPKSMYKCFEV